MSTIENDPAKAERKQISLSSFIAIELVNDLTEFERRQIEHAVEIKKRLKTLSQSLNHLGAFSQPEESERRYKRTHEEGVIIKILHHDEVKLENARFAHDVWLNEEGEFLLCERIIPAPYLNEESREVFKEASAAEYIMLFPFMLKGIGDEVGRSLPRHT